MTTDTILDSEVATDRTPIQRCGGLIIGPQPWEHVGAAQTPAPRPRRTAGRCLRLDRRCRATQPRTKRPRRAWLCCSNVLPWLWTDYQAAAALNRGPIGRYLAI